MRAGIYGSPVQMNVLTGMPLSSVQVYSAQRLHCADLPGMMRFFDWLPIHHTQSVTAGRSVPECSACTGTGAFKPVYHVQRVLAGERGGYKNLFV